MFEKRQIRVAAGFLYGGTYGILLGALYYSRYWAPRPGFTESEQVWICVQHLMVGMVSGVVFGLILGIRPRAWASWIGSLGFGLLGVYAIHPLLETLIGPLAPLSQPETKSTHFAIIDWTSVGMAELMPYVGIFVGPLLWEWIKKAWRAAE